MIVQLAKDQIWHSQDIPDSFQFLHHTARIKAWSLLSLFFILVLTTSNSAAERIAACSITAAIAMAWLGETSLSAAGYVLHHGILPAATPSRVSSKAHSRSESMHLRRLS